MKKPFLIVGIIISIVAVSLYIAFKVSPWPAALLIRYAFEQEAEKVNDSLEKHVPQGISQNLDIVYDPTDPDALLDIYYPAVAPAIYQSMAVIVWVHGGGWISGKKEHLRNYSKLLASKGYVVVAIDYSIAPEEKYPRPVIQTNEALKFLNDNSEELKLNFSSVFLAGDSGGAQIVAQNAAIISDATYAKLMGITPAIHTEQLSGMILYCGAYDIGQADFSGDFGGFLRTVLWAYSGTKDIEANASLKGASIIDFVGPEFPPSFISAGNGDPLLSHSRAFAKKLGPYGVTIDSLFFPMDYKPELPHEYQFNLDTDAAKIALDKSLDFLQNNK